MVDRVNIPNPQPANSPDRKSFRVSVKENVTKTWNEWTQKGKEWLQNLRRTPPDKALQTIAEAPAHKKELVYKEIPTDTTTLEIHTTGLDKPPPMISYVTPLDQAHIVRVKENLANLQGAEIIVRELVDFAEEQRPANLSITPYSSEEKVNNAKSTFENAVSILQTSQTSEKKEQTEIALRRFEQFMDALVYSEVKTIMPYLTDKLGKKIDKLGFENAGFIIVGSSVMGRYLRDLAGTIPETKDIDLVFVYDSNSKLNRNELQPRAFRLYKQIEKILKSKNIPQGYTQCIKHNVSSIELHIPNFVQESIEDPSNSQNSYSFLEQTISYFYPSFPPSVNQKNRRAVLHAFHEFSQSSPEEWKKLKAQLVNHWVRVTQVKKQYFRSDNEDAAFYEGYSKIRYSYTELQSQVFLQVLDTV